jgi:8-oxo-dGTP pyrophosphatase MutT (NUDIX family)
MDDRKILETIKHFGRNLPRFPDGRIDYSNANVAPVITVFVRCKKKYLLLKRSDKVGTYRGKWNAVGGYLDELKPIREKVLEELKEELGIDEKNISSIIFGKSYELVDKEVGKTWLVHPVLVEVKKGTIKLDWEHTDYKWIELEELADFDTIPQLDRSLKNVL